MTNEDCYLLNGCPDFKFYKRFSNKQKYINYLENFIKREGEKHDNLEEVKKGLMISSKDSEFFRYINEDIIKLKNECYNDDNTDWCSVMFCGGDSNYLNLDGCFSDPFDFEINDEFGHSSSSYEECFW